MPELWCTSQTGIGSCIAVAVVQTGSCGSNLTPSLGTSTFKGCGPKKQENKNKKTQNQQDLAIQTFLLVWHRLWLPRNTTCSHPSKIEKQEYESKHSSTHKRDERLKSFQEGQKAGTNVPHPRSRSVCTQLPAGQQARRLGAPRALTTTRSQRGAFSQRPGTCLRPGPNRTGSFPESRKRAEVAAKARPALGPVCVYQAPRDQLGRGRSHLEQPASSSGCAGPVEAAASAAAEPGPQPEPAPRTAPASGRPRRQSPRPGPTSSPTAPPARSVLTRRPGCRSLRSRSHPLRLPRSLASAAADTGSGAGTG